MPKGTQPFGHLDILTRPPVLIPRPETEHWTLRLAQSIRPSPQNPAHVLDLCTGTGCIPLLLCATWFPGSTSVVGIDTSLEALQLAQDNAIEHASIVDLVFPHRRPSTFPDALFLHHLRLHLPPRIYSYLSRPMSVIPLNSSRRSPFGAHSTLSPPTHPTSLEANIPNWTNLSEPSRIPVRFWAIHQGHRTRAVSPFISISPA
jgi:SAM-dependent methyltransferase